MHRTFSVERIDDDDDDDTLNSSTQRYTIMFAFHVALNKITQPEASSVVMTVCVCVCINLTSFCFDPLLS